MTPPTAAPSPSTNSRPPLERNTLFLQRIARSRDAPAAVALLHLLLCLLALNPVPHTGGDNAAYISLARSLLERGDYTDVWDPAMRPHAQYPPAFAGILALGLALGLGSWVQLKLLIVAFSTAAVALSVLWLRRVTSPGLALVVGLMLALAPGILNLSHWVLSDVPFWAFAMLALWTYSHLRPGSGAAPTAAPTDAATPDAAKWRMAWGLGLALAVTLAYFTRSAGLPLVVALALVLGVRRAWRELALLGAVLAPPALLWWARNAQAQGSGYLGQFWLLDPYQPELGAAGLGGMAERIADNLVLYTARLVPELFFGSVALGWLTGGLLLLAALVGWARRLGRAELPEAFVLLYLATILVWPATWAGTRFLLPVAPLLLLYAGETVRDLSARLRRPAVPRAALALPLALLILPGVAWEVRTGMHCRGLHAAGDTFGCLIPEWRDFFSVAMQSRDLLPEGTVVLSRKPQLFFVFSGHQSRLYPKSAEPSVFFEAAEAAGAEFVVVDQSHDLAPLYLHPVLLARRDDFCVVPELTLPNAALARIEPGGPARASDAPPNAFRSCPLTGARE
jgi:4-amino-4-deoxy-L-arabinose transferase-like glycosyltransferase